jgi:transposase
MLKSGHVKGPPRPHRPARRPADPAEVAARYGSHRSWVYKLKARYQADGEAAFEPRSRRPKTNPTAIPPATVALIVELRGKLTTAGLDTGPDTIAWHLSHHHGTTVSVSTISRTLTRAGLVTPTPKKRPKTSYQRFQAELPNQCWQEVTRRVSASGLIGVCYQQVSASRHLAGQIVTVRLHPTVLQVVFAGQLIRTVPRTSTKEVVQTPSPPTPPA